MAIKTVSRVRVAALILSCIAVTIAAAPRAEAQAAYGRAEAPGEALARHMRVLAGEPRDFQALMGAGKAALALGDTQAAAGFFGRAEEVWPASPMPKAGIGAALAHDGDAAGALQYFAVAARSGAAVQSFAVERGLAFDLLGRHSEAQSDYRIALATADADEARRRLALSLAITGNKSEAIALLGPLVARGDAAAGRCRALVLALTGDAMGARSAIEAAMPGSAVQMGYFFAKLPSLRSDQKAAAVHLGVFPEVGQAGVAVASAPPGDRLKSIEEMLATSKAPPQPVVQRQPAATVAPALPPTRMASAAVRRTVPATASAHRYWVQLASGPNPAALPNQFKRIQRRYPDLLDDLNPYVADDGGRSRLLIGPFKDSRAAADFADGLESSGLDAFSWTAPQGQPVRKLPAE